MCRPHDPEHITFGICQLLLREGMHRLQILIDRLHCVGGGSAGRGQPELKT